MNYLSEEQFELLVDYIDSLIEVKIDNAFGRDNNYSYLSEAEKKEKLKNSIVKGV